jgi:hypothetical protein
MTDEAAEAMPPASTRLSSRSSPGSRSKANSKFDRHALHLLRVYVDCSVRGPPMAENQDRQKTSDRVGWRYMNR